MSQVLFLPSVFFLDLFLVFFLSTPGLTVLLSSKKETEKEKKKEKRKRERPLLVVAERAWPILLILPVPTGSGG